jgi:lipopolysaccharide assembly outer membrane protein LptD (OstA)
MPIAIGQGRNDVTALQRQLKADLETLQDDEKKRASQAIIAADQTRVQTDQQAITAAGSADTRQKSTESRDRSRQTKAVTVNGVAARAHGAGDTTSGLPMRTFHTVDLYL